MEQAEASTDGQTIAGASPQTVETQETPTESHDQQKPEARTNGGYQPPVDLSTLPDDIRAPVEARFAHLSRLMKKNELRSTSELNEWRKVAQEQSRIIEELQSGVGAVVDHLQDKSLSDAETQIMQRMEQAHEAGDTKAFIAAQKELSKIEAKKLLMEERKNAPKPAKEAQPGRAVPRNGADIANEAAIDGEISGDEARIIGAYQTETDDTGELLRPWTHARTQNPLDDPEYVRGIINARAIWANPKFSTPAQKLAEMDRVMGTVKRNATQNVMGGSLTNARKTTKISLTPNQERIAIRTKIAGPKASDADHLKVYLEQIEKVKARKGNRA